MLLLITIIIPIYKGARILHRSLKSLAAQQLGSDLAARDVEIILAVNDGRSDSLAEAYAGSRLLEARGFRVSVITTPTGREHAFRIAEEAADPGSHRLYLDQDARLSPGGLAALASALRNDAQFVAFRGMFDRSRSMIVRAYCRYWSSLPYVMNSPVTMGAYAVSAYGRRRWATLPPSIPDDKYVRLLFKPEERRLLSEESYHVIPPQHWMALVRMRSRYIRANRRLDRSGLVHPDDVPRYKGLFRPLREPARWLDFFCFMMIYAAAAANERLPGRRT